MFHTSTEAERQQTSFQPRPFWAKRPSVARGKAWVNRFRNTRRCDHPDIVFFFRLERNLEKFALGPHFIPVAAIDGTTIRASRPSQLTAVNIRRSPSGRNWRTFVGHRTTGRGADMGLARVGKDKKKRTGRPDIAPKSKRPPKIHSDFKERSTCVGASFVLRPSCATRSACVGDRMEQVERGARVRVTFWLSLSSSRSYPSTNPNFKSASLHGLFGLVA